MFIGLLAAVVVAWFAILRWPVKWVEGWLSRRRRMTLTDAVLLARRETRFETLPQNVGGPGHTHVIRRGPSVIADSGLADLPFVPGPDGRPVNRIGFANRLATGGPVASRPMTPSEMSAEAEFPVPRSRVNRALHRVAALGPVTEAEIQAGEQVLREEDVAVLRNAIEAANREPRRILIADPEMMVRVTVTGDAEEEDPGILETIRHGWRRGVAQEKAKKAAKPLKAPVRRGRKRITGKL